MKKVEYARMAEYEASYWWHLGRLRIIETKIKQFVGNKKKLAILNVGCGTGGTIKMLEQFGVVDNVDVSDEAIAFMKKNGFKRIKKVSGIELPYKDKSYDLVAAFDVLEHIDNDEAALSEWNRVLKEDGVVIVTVPAYQWLWSDHDISLHHFRRYTTRLLKARAHVAGLRAQRLSYAIVFSLPLVVGFRFINKHLGRKANSETSYVALPGVVNKLFANFLYIEAWIHKYISFLFGTSVIATLRKNK